MTPTSRRRWMIAAVPLGLAAAAAIGFAIAEHQGWPFLKGPLQTNLAERLHRPVELGDEFRLHLLGSIRLDTSALRIGAPANLPPDSPLAGDLVNARNAHLELPYGTLRRWIFGNGDIAPRIVSLRASNIDAKLVRSADGAANWTFSPQRREIEPKPTDLPSVEELVVERGHIVVDDAILQTQLDARINTAEGAQSGGLHVQGQGKHQGRPFELDAASTGIVPLIKRSTTVAVPVRIRLRSGDAAFSFDGTGTDVMSFYALDGDAVLSGPSLAKVGDAIGLTLPTTAPFTLKGRLGKSGTLWSLKDADLRVGESHLGGQFSVDRSQAVPMLSGALTG
ncbi:MAG TPA: hypothetical protein VJ598_08610, partial [Albitalea sp.]|nr:hypothetical protein [Albitalea sp.]